jgi:hypothetical protein
MPPNQGTAPLSLATTINVFSPRKDSAVEVTLRMPV